MGDLSAFKHFTLYSKERAYGRIKGGGLMTFVRPGLNHSRWDPGLVMFPYLDAERAWVLIHIAMCAVYCAAEVADGHFKAWNYNLFAMIKQEIQVIKAESVNFNGTLIRDFVSPSNMRSVNADVSRCCGLYTRVTANSISCLDYVLEENKEHNTVSSMKIDVNSEVLGGSDHSAIFIELCATKVVLDPMEKSAPRISNPTSKTASAYSRALDNILDSELEYHRH